MRLTRTAAIVLIVLALVAPRAASLQAAGNVQVLAAVGGQPDDITVDAHGRLLWGDLAAGTIDRLVAGRVVTIARGLSVPEGVLALHNGSLIVAEQGLDRIDRISPSGLRTILYVLQPVPGQEGVDGIGRDPRSRDLLIPDSPRGTVLRLSANGKRARIIAAGLGRPVDAAVDAHGNVLVPDEHLGTLLVISPRGRVAHRGVFSTPDDVAVAANGVIWVTSLGDGGLWKLAPGSMPQEILSGLSNPQGLVLDRCGNPIIVDQNSARILRLLLSRNARNCAI